MIICELNQKFRIFPESGVTLGSNVTYQGFENDTSWSGGSLPENATTARTETIIWSWKVIGHPSLPFPSTWKYAFRRGPLPACLPACQQAYLALWFTNQSTTSEVNEAALILLHFRRKTQLLAQKLMQLSKCLFVRCPLISRGYKTIVFCITISHLKLSLKQQN